MLPPISSVLDGWTKFLLLYAKVIEDCPLEINSTNATSSVEKITISVELVNKLVEAQQLYKITWNIVERNGEIGQIYVLNSFSVM